MLRLLLPVACAALLSQGCREEPKPAAVRSEDYATARASFKTRLAFRAPSPQLQDMPVAPSGVRVVEYKSGGLKLRAWSSKSTERNRPAVLFLHGGFAFGVEDWDMADPFRKAGYVVMAPILRGENGQPGDFTLLYDEVDDVLAALEALRSDPSVDKDRIFVAGHSAGGTLTLLTALCTKDVRAAASFSGAPDHFQFSNSPGVADIVPYDRAGRAELEMRSPNVFVKSLKCPTRLYFGSEERLFGVMSRAMADAGRSAGKDIEAIETSGDHFTSVNGSIQKAIAFFDGS
ncbi:MAG: alpha/beta fold hydrolase [Armatimonadetes bacterium]|nr:alpha/beta fold hydrolase [Armatimonadota bacterium]